MVVENSLDLHKPVEIGGLRPCGACATGVYRRRRRNLTRRTKAADGSLRGREWGD